MLPGTSAPKWSAASYSPLDGHCNSLRLFRALHTALQQLGATYLPSHIVERVDYAGGGFALSTKRRRDRAPARSCSPPASATRDSRPWSACARRCGPQRGQIIVTEQTQPFLRYPVVTIRQTDEGTVMLGDCQQEGTQPRCDDGTPVIAVMADRARAHVSAARPPQHRAHLGGVRVMTEDGFPIYDQSATLPARSSPPATPASRWPPTMRSTLAPLIAAGKLPRTRSAPSARGGSMFAGCLI